MMHENEYENGFKCGLTHGKEDAMKSSFNSDAVKEVENKSREFIMGYQNGYRTGYNHAQGYNHDRAYL